MSGTTAEENVRIQKINWLIARQSVAIALLIPTFIGALTILRFSQYYILYILLIGGCMFGFWAALNYEAAIIKYQMDLGKIRSSWSTPPNTMIKYFFDKNHQINWYFLLLCYGLFSLIAYYLGIFTLSYT